MAQAFKRDSIGRFSGGGANLKSGAAKTKRKRAKRKSNSGSLSLNAKASGAISKRR